jgi:hypothetical protein
VVHHSDVAFPCTVRQHKHRDVTVHSLCGQLRGRATCRTVRRDGVDILDHQVLVDVVDVGLVLAENQHRGGRFLEALEEVDNLRLLLHVLHLLDHVEIRSACVARPTLSYLM